MSIYWGHEQRRLRQAMRWGFAYGLVVGSTITFIAMFVAGCAMHVHLHLQDKHSYSISEDAVAERSQLDEIVEGLLDGRSAEEKNDVGGDRHGGGEPD